MWLVPEKADSLRGFGRMFSSYIVRAASEIREAERGRKERWKERVREDERNGGISVTEDQDGKAAGYG